MVGGAPTRRGARCPRSRFRTRGPNSPRLPPGFARRAVVGLCPPFLSAPASPRKSRHAPWALRPQAARGGGSSRARFGGLAAGACVCQGALFPRRSAAFIARWSPMGCSKLRYALLGAPHRLAPVRQTTEGAPWQTHALSSRRRPKRFCPLEPLTPHAACARTRPPFGRPLPRFRGLAPRCPSLDVLGLPKKPFEHYGFPAPDPRGTRFFWEPSAATSTDGTAADPTAEKDILKGRESPLPPMRLRRKKSIGGRGWGPLPLLRHHFCAAHKFPYGATPLCPLVFPPSMKNQPIEEETNTPKKNC